MVSVLILPLLALGRLAAQVPVYTGVEVKFVPTAINASGQIAGYGDAPGGTVHAFLYSGGTTIDLGVLPGGNHSEATGINANGDVVGNSTTGSGLTHAFLYSGGAMFDLGTLPGGATSYATAINDAGQITGWSDTLQPNTTYPRPEHAFLYSGGVMTDLGNISGPTNWGNFSHGTAINSAGEVVGWSVDDNFNTHAFRYSGGAMADLGTLGGTESRATGINDSGTVVGWSNTSGDAATHAFKYAGGMSDLGTISGNNGSSATGINNAGQIVGNSLFSGTPAFIYTDLTGIVKLDTHVNGAGWNLRGAPAISSAGQIIASGSNGTVFGTYFLLSPQTGSGTTYTITGSPSPAAGGSISGGGTVNSGSSVTLVATPAVGYSFVNWTEGGSSVGMLANYNFTASASRTLVAHFSPNSDANLDALVVSGAALTPAFASGTTSYSARVNNATTFIAVIPTAADSTATIRVNGATVGSGVPSGALPLKVGANLVTILVAAQSHATKTYSLVVTRGQAPVVSVLSPGNGAALPVISAPGAVTVVGSTKDDVGVEQVLVSLNGGAFVAANLHPGARPTDSVKWDLPVAPENGYNILTVQTVDVDGNNSMPKTIHFRYQVASPEQAGFYTGLATPTGESSNPARHVGLGKVTVGNTGAFTGSLRLGGSPTAIHLNATFGNGGNARFGKGGASTLEIQRAGLPSLFLALNLDVSATLAQQVTGTLTENGTVVSTVELNRALYTAGKIPTGSPLMLVPRSVLNPLTDKGAYTCVFQALAPLNEGVAAAGYPQGDGWALAKVKPSGAVAVSGKLADGQPFTFSSYLSKDNVLPLYLNPYAGTGTVSGPVSFRDVPGQSDADGLGLRWFKPANPGDTAYRSGWPGGIKVDFLASKFVLPAKPTTTNPAPLYVLGTDNILGLRGAPPSVPVTLVLADGGITPTTGISKAATLAAKNKVTIAGPADALNLKASFPTDIMTHQPTGKLTGSFNHPGNNKTVPFSGVVYQKLHTASGCFLYFPPKPAGQPAPSGVSGSVGIAP